MPCIHLVLYTKLSTWHGDYLCQSRLLECQHNWVSVSEPHTCDFNVELSLLCIYHRHMYSPKLQSILRYFIYVARAPWARPLGRPMVLWTAAQLVCATSRDRLASETSEEREARLTSCTQVLIARNCHNSAACSAWQYTSSVAHS